MAERYRHDCAPMSGYCRACRAHDTHAVDDDCPVAERDDLRSRLTAAESRAAEAAAEEYRRTVGRIAQVLGMEHGATLGDVEEEIEAALRTVDTLRSLRSRDADAIAAATARAEAVEAKLAESERGERDLWERVGILRDRLAAVERERDAVAERLADYAMAARIKALREAMGAAPKAVRDAIRKGAVVYRGSMSDLATDVAPLVESAIAALLPSREGETACADPCPLCHKSIATECRCDKATPGYYHPDLAIDAEVRADVAERDAIDRACGITPGWHKGRPDDPDPRGEDREAIEAWRARR